MPIDFSMENMVLGKPMLEAMVLGKEDRTVKAHVLKLSDGTTKTIDTQKWGITIHHGNGFQKDENTIVFTGAGYSDPTKNPFEAANFE